ncbi:MAG: hypothetical protein QM784_29900 [Polyangiaceae bacterium]
MTKVTLEPKGGVSVLSMKAPPTLEIASVTRHHGSSFRGTCHVHSDGHS